MKKLILIFICILFNAIFINAQVPADVSVIGNYRMTYNFDDYSVYRNSSNYYIQLDYLYLSDDVFIIIKNTDIQSFISDLLIMQDTLIEYSWIVDKSKHHLVCYPDIKLPNFIITWKSDKTNKWQTAVIKPEVFCHYAFNTSYICFMFDPAKSSDYTSYLTLTIDDINNLIKVLKN